MYFSSRWDQRVYRVCLHKICLCANGVAFQMPATFTYIISLLYPLHLVVPQTGYSSNERLKRRTLCEYWGSSRNFPQAQPHYKTTNTHRLLHVLSAAEMMPSTADDKKTRCRRRRIKKKQWNTIEIWWVVRGACASWRSCSRRRCGKSQTAVIKKSNKWKASRVFGHTDTLTHTHYCLALGSLCVFLNDPPTWSFALLTHSPTHQFTNSPAQRVDA